MCREKHGAGTFLHVGEQMTTWFCWQTGLLHVQSVRLPQYEHFFWTRLSSGSVSFRGSGTKYSHSVGSTRGGR